MPSPIDLELATHHVNLLFHSEHGVTGTFMCHTGNCADDTPHDPHCPGASWLNSWGRERWTEHYVGSPLADVRSGPIVLSRPDNYRWAWRYHQPGTFVRYIEHNEHEGEDWSFWLQREGNSVALEQLEHRLDNQGDDDAEPISNIYELRTEDVESGPDVDLLYVYGADGYMDQHNKVLGRLVVPDDLSFETLYKGGIRDLFKEW